MLFFTWLTVAWNEWKPSLFSWCFYHNSAVQVDVFTVTYKRFDSLVSRNGTVPSSPVNLLLNESGHFSPHCSLLSSTDCKRNEGNLVVNGGSDGAETSQQPVPSLSELAGHLQRQSFLTEKVRNHHTQWSVLYGSPSLVPSLQMYHPVSKTAAGKPHN